MKNNLKSILKFNEYFVDKIEFTRNENCQSNDFELDLDIKKNVSYDKDTKIGNVQLDVSIFSEPYENNYPFSLKILITGIFTIDCDDAELLENLLNKNTVSILFPYIRALITTYTANANVDPLILPPINVNNLIEN